MRLHEVTKLKITDLSGGGEPRLTCKVA